MEGIKEKAIAIIYEKMLKSCHDEAVAKYWASEEYLFLEPTAFMLDVSKDEIDGKPTREVYKKYRSWCFKHNTYPISQCAFSRRLRNYFGIVILDKRVKELNGEKFRVFKVV